MKFTKLGNQIIALETNNKIKDNARTVHLININNLIQEL